ncbi:Gfo/Idh/MocA family protein [Marinicrinis lubricantis]|uniref:Gfo/Idh/MocA family protein n=1 Tax=Marinicrinis lubricantis TaxID=2086470 RepID=A0ABW1IUB8_9BACL
MKKVTVGFIGCGNISSIYLKNLLQEEHIFVKACADMEQERAISQAEKFSIPAACSVPELLADPDIDIVVNLTIPQAHAAVSLQALQHGKHVYLEKPLGIATEEASEVIRTAKEKGLRVACAPETFMGGGIQTCLQLIDNDAIGQPVAAAAFMMGRGHEHWHPNPEFYYQTGGGPLFDMGPYYLTALVQLLGPIQSISASAKITFPQRTILSEPKKGEIIQVETPTHVSSTLDFHQGATATMVMSFDVMAGHSLPNIEIYGTKGTLQVPDPNNFSGTIRLKKTGDKEWTDIPVSHAYTDNCRGIGVKDLAYAILNEREHRASGEMAFHVLEAMEGCLVSAKEHKSYVMQSTCSKPAPVPKDGIVS